MEETRNTSATLGSVGFFDLLFLVFLVLKLTNVITWSWWWVTAPLWAPICAVIAFLILFGLFAITIKIIS